MTAFDCNPLVLQQSGFARRADLAGKDGSPARLTGVRGDLRRLPFRPASFDRILCVSTIEHVEGQNGDTDAVREIASALRQPAGSFQTDTTWWIH